MAELDLAMARRQLDALSHAHLIQSVTRDRYRLHDLLGAYARDRTEHTDTAYHRDRAVVALLRWYAYHAISVCRILYPAAFSWHQMLDHVRPANLTMETVSAVDATNWLDTEHDNLIAITRMSAQCDQHQLTIALAYTAGWVMYHRGQWADSIEVRELGVVAARRCGDRVAEAHTLLYLGASYQAAYRRQEALANFQKALELSRIADDRWLEAGA